MHAPDGPTASLRAAAVPPLMQNVRRPQGSDALTLPYMFAVGVALFSALAGPVATVQQPTLPRIGVLWPGDVTSWTDAFLNGLRENGYVGVRRHGASMTRIARILCES